MALRWVRATPWLALLMVQGVAVFTLSRICQVNLFQPILLDHGIGESAHGGVLAAMTVAEAVASARPQWLGRRLTPATWVTLLSVALAGTLAGITLGGPWTVVALLCVFAAVTGFAYPVQRKLVNDAIPALAPRATLLSVESIVDRGVCALAAVAAGAYLSADRLDALLWHSAIVTAVVMTAVQLALRSRKKAAEIRRAGRGAERAARTGARELIGTAAVSRGSAPYDPIGMFPRPPVGESRPCRAGEGVTEWPRAVRIRPPRKCGEYVDVAWERIAHPSGRAHGCVGTPAARPSAGVTIATSAPVDPRHPEASRP